MGSAVRDEWWGLGLGSHRLQCPSCSGERRNKHQRCLSLLVEPDRLVWTCHHCMWSGASPRKRAKVFRPAAFSSSSRFSSGEDGMNDRILSVVDDPVSVSDDEKALSEVALGWLSKRGISAATALSEGLFSKDYGFPGQGRREGIWFPYCKKPGEDAYAHKIRTGDTKLFVQAGGASTFWRADRVSPDDADLFIVEGEIDAMSLVEVGITNVVSVPNGAPIKVSEGKVSPEEDRRFKYVWDGKDLLSKAKRVVIAVDADEPGRALGEELARRIGKAVVWRVVWPEGCKDANDVLRLLGRDKLIDTLSNPEPWPVAGVYDAKHYSEGVRGLYAGGLGKGLSTGFQSLDDHYTVVPGHLCVVTGAPGSGKTSWLNSVMVNMARDHDWSFAIWSTETTPEIHISQLASLYCEKPFFNAESGERLSEEELDRSIEWINDHFVFLTGDGGTVTPDDIVERLKTAVLRYGVRGAVIDPASYLARPARADDASASDSVGQMLELFKSFAVSHDVSMWLIAHPYKLRPNVDGSTVVPKGYEISGSASWYNRPDFGLTIHRPAEDRRVTEVHNWKTRFAWTGSEGKIDLFHDRDTGRYSEQPFVSMAPRVVTSFYEAVKGDKDPWN